jgi:hypothetical protein
MASEEGVRHRDPGAAGGGEQHVQQPGGRALRPRSSPLRDANLRVARQQAAKEVSELLLAPFMRPPPFPASLLLQGSAGIPPSNSFEIRPYAFAVAGERNPTTHHHGFHQCAEVRFHSLEVPLSLPKNFLVEFVLLVPGRRQDAVNDVDLQETGSKLLLGGGGRSHSWSGRHPPRNAMLASDCLELALE